jgi:hypothetical protein
MTDLRPIPACINCKHCITLDYTDDAECGKYYQLVPDYLNGGWYRIYRKIDEVRDDDSVCGRDAKDFEQKEVKARSWWDFW